MNKLIMKALYAILICCLAVTSLSLPAKEAQALELDKQVENELLAIPDFIDLRGHYAEEAVKRLSSLRYVNGVSANRFDPQKHISRSDFAVLLAKSAGIFPSEKTSLTYLDVQAGTPQAAYIHTLAEMGILKGKPDQTVGAMESLTRQDMAVLLYRLMRILSLEEHSSATQAFSDEQDISDYAREAVYKVAAIGWLKGSDNRFSPRNKVTRAEAAVVVDRIVAMRINQAEKAEFEVNLEKMSVLAGTSHKIEVTPKGSKELPFAPVFSFDHREIGTILPDGTFIAGPAAGKGQITVSVGYKSVVIPVEITVSGEESPVQSEGNVESDGEPVAEDNSESSWEQPEGLENFAPHSHFSVKSLDPSDPAFQKMEQKYPGPVGGLVALSDTWTGYLRQKGREITVTLDQAKSLQQVALTFKQDSKAGIYFPTEMEIEVSKDGKAWSYAGKALNSVSQADMAVMERTMIVTLPVVDAKFVRVRFPVKVFVFARQLKVLGHSDMRPYSKPTLLAATKQTSPYEDKKAADKIKDVVLVFTGGYGELGTWKQEDFLPHVGYVSQDGVIRDRMFDTIQFMPYPNLPTTSEGWESYIDNLFEPGRQLDALNEAMLEMNKRRGTLVLDRAVESVILALPYPSPKQNDFGVVVENQDSLSFDPSRVGEEMAARYRKQAVEWYLDKLLKRWNEADFRFLKLEGIYWYHELIDESAPKERELVRDVSRMVHDRALRFYWIPYFGSPGLADWKELGFDYAFLQPNFYFDKTIPVERMEVALATANKYGMGVEVEGDTKMLTDIGFYRMYYNQLIAGHKLGIDRNKIHAYYFGSKGLLHAYRSKDPNIRAIYDDTYRWMRGKFTISEYMDPLQAP